MRHAFLICVLTFSITGFAHGGEFPIAKFRAISSTVFAGGNPVSSDGSLDGLDFLKGIGIRTVISLQGADVDGTASGWISHKIHHGERQEFIDLEACAVEARGMRFLNFPIRSRLPWSEKDHDAVDLTLRHLAAATNDNPVYLHCQRGIDRTGLIIALHRIYNEGWEHETAHQEWQNLGRTALARWVTRALDRYYCERVLSGPTS